MTTLPMRPRLASKARLTFDRHEGRHFLLYPEKGLSLGETSAAIVALCDGARTVEAIVAELSRAHADTPPDRIDRDVRSFLGELQSRGLLAEGE